MKTPGTIVIVGAGLSGARCAETLRSEGYEGVVVLVGDEPHAPYERPALSKGFLTGKRDLAEMTLHAPTFWADKQIDLRLGTRVVAVDQRSPDGGDGPRRRAALGRPRPCDRDPPASPSLSVPGRRPRPAHRHRRARTA